jgi:hypothetical protein
MMQLVAHLNNFSDPTLVRIFKRITSLPKQHRRIQLQTTNESAVFYSRKGYPPHPSDLPE